MTDPSSSRKLAQLEEVLGYTFRDRELLKQALTHRSHAYERGADALASYERLEFLGDSLLGFVVADWLYCDDAEATEGGLSRRRQAVVRTSTLAAAARAIGLGRAMKLGRGELQSGGREKPSLLADLFEAVLGAVYLDGGVVKARAMIRRHLGEPLKKTRGKQIAHDDYKTRLQERVQARSQRTPSYRILSTEGPDHELEFVVEVQIGGKILAQGSGSNRKAAEQQAARAALEMIAAEADV